MKTLAEVMDAKGETVLGLAKRAGVTWRTVRDARDGKLRNATKAKQIADTIGRDAKGRYLVDPLSMLGMNGKKQSRTKAA
jgi:hypothetical protein